MARFVGKKVLVTGATAGIGEATALAFAAAGAEVVLVARRKDRLTQLTKDLRASGATAHVLVLDVSDRKQVQRAAKKHVDLLDVDILVNNAGLAKGLDPMPTADYDDWATMVETNILGLLSLTREVLPHMERNAMTERGPGHIVNLGSVAGRWVYPGGGVYAATKFAVRALTEGLRYDLAGSGIRVTNIAPGLVETEFSIVRFEGDEERAGKVYANMTPLSADDIADTILWSCSRPPHVNVQELVVYPTDQAGVTHVTRK